MTRGGDHRMKKLSSLDIIYIAIGIAIWCWGIKYAYGAFHDDTRKRAHDWIEKFIPEGKGILIDYKGNSVDMLLDYAQLERSYKKAVSINSFKKEYLKLQLEVHPGRGHGWKIFTIKRAFRNPLRPMDISSLPSQVEEYQAVQENLVEVNGDISRLKKMGIDYVVVNMQVLRDTINMGWPNIDEFYNQLPEYAPVIKKFPMLHDYSQTDEIRIFKLL